MDITWLTVSCTTNYKQVLTDINNQIIMSCLYEKTSEHNTFIAWNNSNKGVKMPHGGDFTFITITLKDAHYNCKQK